MKTLIKNGIGFFGPNYEVHPINVLIKDTKIEAVSQLPIEAGPDAIVYDVRGNLVMPGIVDTHTHLTQSFGRGIYDNRHLTQWLLTMIHNFDLTDEEVYAAAMLGCVEAIKSGTTTVAEMATSEQSDIIFQAIADSGLRGDVCGAFGDHKEGDGPEPDKNASQQLDAMHEMYKRWHGTYAGRMTVRMGPVGLPACTEELMRGSRALANQLGVGIHTHCCEGDIETADSLTRFGKTEVEAIASFGLLGPDCTLVHSIWLTDHDMDLIAETRSNVVTCPSTNTKITDGMPPMPPLHRRGVNIAIGCDGESSSGTYDMLQEARLVSLLGKIRDNDAAMFKAEEVYEMMTINGAKAIGYKDVGELKPGYKADITVINYPAAHLIDERRLMSNLIFSATGGDVNSVFVDGKPLMLNKQLTQMDEEKFVCDTLQLMRRATHPLPK